MAKILAPEQEIQLTLSVSGGLLGRSNGVQSVPNISDALYAHIVERVRDQHEKHLARITRHALQKSHDRVATGVLLTARRDPIIVTPLVQEVAIGNNPWAKVLLGLPLFGESQHINAICRDLASTFRFPLTLRPSGSWLETIVSTGSTRLIRVGSIKTPPIRMKYVLSNEVPDETQRLEAQGVKYAVA